MLEELAKLAEEIGYKWHNLAMDPQEDSSDVTGEKIAEAIRTYQPSEIEIPAERLEVLNA